MKKFEGHLYETHPDWHTVVVRRSSDWRREIIHKSAWLGEHCPGADQDYDAYCHHDDTLQQDNHRTVYFFRDKEVAMLFALTWS